MHIGKQYKAVVFLDRDGVINADKGYVHQFEDFTLLPGVIEALKKLQELGCCVLVVSNQSGIARGLYSQNDLDRLQVEIDKYFETLGIGVQGFYYCPELESPNRKPEPGMLKHALHEHFETCMPNLPMYMVGDKLSDMQAGKAVNCHCILIPNPAYPIGGDVEVVWDATAVDLRDAVMQIKGLLV